MGPKTIGKNVNITNPGKLAILGLVVIGCMAYIIATLFAGGDTTPAWAAMTLIIGYLIGNGSGARQGIVTVPPLSPTPERQVEHLQKQIDKIESVSEITHDNEQVN